MNDTLTLEQWLQARNDRVPGELQERVRILTHEMLDKPANPHLLADVARTQLDALVKTGVTSRDVALDLLAVDAIATYSLELAASTGVELSESAAVMMHAIASLMNSEEPQPGSPQ